MEMKKTQKLRPDKQTENGKEIQEGQIKATETQIRSRKTGTKEVKIESKKFLNEKEKTSKAVL